MALNQSDKFKMSMTLHAQLECGGSLYVYELDEYPGICVSCLSEKVKGVRQPTKIVIEYSGKEYRKAKHAVKAWLKNCEKWSKQKCGICGFENSACRCTEGA